MKLLALIAFLFVGNIVNGQTGLNKALKRQMDSVVLLDQKYREALTLLSDPSKSDQIAKKLSLTVQQANNYYWKLQNSLDSANIIFVESVFKKYGYPGKTLVGPSTNEAAWNIVQHSQKIDIYLPIIKEAADKKELPYHLYGMMLDRHLLMEGKEQVYGSQVICRFIKGRGNECFVWPIENAESVNERRKKAGFDLTVEQNATRLGVTYRVIKISEVK